MTEVIRVPRDPARSEQAAGESRESDSERPETTVIRVGSRRASSDGVFVEPPIADPEPQNKEVIRVAAPARQVIAKPVPAERVVPQTERDTASAHDTADREASTGKPERQLQGLAAVAAVFSDSLKALDLVAAEQARWVVSIAERLAETIRSPGQADSHPSSAGYASDNGEVEALVTALKRTADTQMKALTTAQARLAEMAADDRSDYRLSARSMSPGASCTPVEAAVANMVSNLNLAQQNAVANQESMNSIAQAAISAGVSLLYGASDRPAPGSDKK